MKKKFRAFTMSEVMITLTVISIIMCFYIPVKKTVDGIYTTLGYFAYNNLKQLSRVLMVGGVSLPDPDNSAVNVGALVSETINGSSQLIFTKNDTLFCNFITEESNTVGAVNCNSLYTAQGTEFVSLNPDNPTFTATNGSRFYLTSRVADTPNSVSSTYGYRLIAVDLNGKRVPNCVAGSSDCRGSRPGDIIIFAIVDNGVVIPVGEAAENRNYINARVKAYKFGDCTGDASCDQTGAFKAWYMTPDDGSTTMDFNEAYCKIHGSTTHFQPLLNCGYVAEGCPSSSDVKADTCELQLIKPIYRYKL